MCLPCTPKYEYVIRNLTWSSSLGIERCWLVGCLLEGRLAIGVHWQAAPLRERERTHAMAEPTVELAVMAVSLADATPGQQLYTALLRRWWP